MTEETGKNSPKDESYTNILYISKMRKVIFLSLLNRYSDKKKQHITKNYSMNKLLLWIIALGTGLTLGLLGVGWVNAVTDSEYTF